MGIAAKKRVLLLAPQIGRPVDGAAHRVDNPGVGGGDVFGTQVNAGVVEQASGTHRGHGQASGHAVESIAKHALVIDDYVIQQLVVALVNACRIGVQGVAERAVGHRADIHPLGLQVRLDFGPSAGRIALGHSALQGLQLCAVKVGKGGPQVLLAQRGGQGRIGERGDVGYAVGVGVAVQGVAVGIGHLQ